MKQNAYIHQLEEKLQQIKHVESDSGSEYDNENDDYGDEKSDFRSQLIQLQNDP